MAGFVLAFPRLACVLDCSLVENGLSMVADWPGRPVIPLETSIGAPIDVPCAHLGPDRCCFVKARPLAERWRTREAPLPTHGMARQCRHA